MVWDLKAKKPILSIVDPSKRYRTCSAVAWNPEQSTKLLIASDDDGCPW